MHCHPTFDFHSLNEIKRIFEIRTELLQSKKSKFLFFETDKSDSFEHNLDHFLSQSFMLLHDVKMESLSIARDREIV